MTAEVEVRELRGPEVGGQMSEGATPGKRTQFTDYKWPQVHLHCAQHCLWIPAPTLHHCEPRTVIIAHILQMKNLKLRTMKQPAQGNVIRKGRGRTRAQANLYRSLCCMFMVKVGAL